jgi:hypothetical protein
MNLGVIPMGRILLALLLGATAVHAADQTILGSQLLVKDPGAAEKRKVSAKAKEKASPDTLVGDPTADGATLTVRADGATSTEQTFPLPQGTNAKGKPFWSGDASKGFKYKDAKGENGPVTQAAIKKSGKGVFTLSFNAQGKRGPISVVPPNPGEGGCVLLALNGGDTYSVAFAPGDGKVTNKSGLFKVTKPANQGTCVVPTSTTSTTVVTTTTTTTSSTPTTVITTSTTVTTTSTTTSTIGTTSTSTTTTPTTSTTSTTGTTIFAGPAFPPTGGNVDFGFTGNAQGAGGADVSLFDFTPTTWTALYWGPFSQNVPAAGLDGSNHVLSTFLGISGVGDTVATWEGTSPWTDPGDMTVYDVPIRFTLTIVAGGLSFEPSTGIAGLDPGPGTGIDVVIDVAPAGTATDFTTNWAFTADIPTDASGFIPLADVPQVGGGGLTSSFGGGFYSQP